MLTSYERQEHCGRHRYRSHLSARQYGRDHRVSVRRVRDWIVHRSAARAPPRTARRRVTYSSINRALTMGCDPAGTKAVVSMIPPAFDAGAGDMQAIKELADRLSLATRSQPD
jgi:hypothetical protein